MKILITGGAGFIGSNLVESLIKSNDIYMIDNFNDFYDQNIKYDNIKLFVSNTKFHLFKFDLLDEKKLSDFFNKYNNFDCIVHVAGLPGVRSSFEYPSLYLKNNCIATINILEQMKKHQINKIIYFSSSSVYGNLNKKKFKEDDCTDLPISPYAASKKSSEVLINTYKEINSIIIRPFTVYGKNMRPDLAIYKFTDLISKNKKITIYGDGNTYRDYTNVYDVVQGVTKSISYLQNNNNVHEIINIGSGCPIILNDVIKIISKHLNLVPKIDYAPMQQGDVLKTYADISKANNLIGYKPKYNFNDGIKEFIEWYLKK